MIYSFNQTLRTTQEGALRMPQGARGEVCRLREIREEFRGRPWACECRCPQARSRYGRRGCSSR